MARDFFSNILIYRGERIVETTPVPMLLFWLIASIGYAVVLAQFAF